MQDRAQALRWLAPTLSAVIPGTGPYISWAQFQESSFLPFLLSHVAAGLDKVSGNVISYQASFQAGEVGMCLRGRMVTMWLENMGPLGELGRPHLRK